MGLLEMSNRVGDIEGVHFGNSIGMSGGQTIG
jgi:hypothetical protein